MKTLDDNLDDILQLCDDLMWKNDIHALNNYLINKINEIKIDKPTRDKFCIWSSYLTFTLPVKSKLKARPELYDLIKQKAIDYNGEAYSDDLLGGLK